MAATLGDLPALRIYQKLLQHTRHVALQTDATLHLFYSDFIDLNDEWDGVFFQKKQQQGEDLGERMANAFRIIFETEAQATKVIIIGSDCPDLTPDLVEGAFEQLDHADFVIGPALDGGYYLLGMRQFEPFVFENMAWSVPSVFEKTVEKITLHQKNYRTVATLSDLDTEADLPKSWKFFL